MKRMKPFLFLCLLMSVLFVMFSLSSCVSKGHENDTQDDTTKPSETEQPTENSSETTTEEVSENTSETEPEPETSKPLEGENAASIEYANSLLNGVNAYFETANRSKYAFENLNAVVRYDLTSKSNKLVTSFESPEGGTYLSNTMDVFIKQKDGSVNFSSDNYSNAYTNIFRLGYYYYDVRILGQAFGGSELQEDVTPYKVALNSFGNVTHDITGLKTKGGLQFTIKSTSDPYVGSRSLSFSTQKYNALEITMRCEASTNAALYLAAGSYSGFNEAQIVHFSVVPGEEFNTYIIPINTIDDYTGSVTGIRIDIGSEVGELIEIQSIKAVKVNDELPIKLDRTFHLYSDKMNEVLHFVAVGDTDNIASYGMLTEIDASTVSSICVEDKNGAHTSLDGVDWNSAVYIGLDIQDVGIFGYILLNDQSSGKLTVTLADGKYSIVQEYTVQNGTSYKTGDAFYMGHRLYTSSDHDMEKFKTEAYYERNPLTEVQITESTDNSMYIGYDVFRGAYRFDVKGTNFSQAFYSSPDKHYLVKASFSSDTPRKIYVYTYENGGCLECAAILDSNGAMLPIGIEVCKNFAGEKEEPLFNPGDPAYGEAILPLVIEPGKANQFTIINLYQNWGNFPLKQLSSIQFIAPYYHLSCGVTETNCIAPYYVYGKDYWTLPDFRGWSSPMWSSQPQHTSIGRLHFLTYTDAEGNKYGSESHKHVIDSYGPTYADISMDYVSDDGKIQVSYRHAEMPHNDENRTYYTIDLTVLEDMAINDFKDNFSLFSFDGRNFYFNKLGYLDENGNPVIIDANNTSTKKYIKLGKDCPYFDYFDAGDGDYVNFALLIKNSDMTLGGEKFDGNFMLTDVKQSDLNFASLTLDIDDITLKAGDSIHIDLILMPWGYKESKDDSNVRNVRQDACIDPYKVDVTVGELMEDTYIPKLMSKDGKAEFTVSGGTNNMAIRIYGFDTYRTIKVEENVQGKWVEYKLHSHNGYDGYTVYYDGDYTYSFAFIIDMTGSNSRTFRVTVDPSLPIPEATKPEEIKNEYSTKCNVIYEGRICFDSVYKNVNGELYEHQTKDGEAQKYLEANPIVLDASWNKIFLHGWTGASSTITAYGYSINKGEVVTNTAWRIDASSDVIAAGGQCRFLIEIPLEDTTKDSYIQLFVVLDNGDVVEMVNFWLKGSES